MPDDPARFYDKLASTYHQVYPNWERSIERQSQVIDALLKRYARKPVSTILDAACGIGTQLLGLTALGYTLTGCDISGDALRRCRREAKARGLKVTLRRGDFRTLDTDVPGTFDAVIAIDNSLPHLLPDSEIQVVCANFYHKLTPGGLLLLSTRDYDAELEKREQMHFRRSEDTDDGRIIMFDIWDWHPDDTYTLNMFQVTQRGNRWNTKHLATNYRALRRAEITAFLDEAGFAGVRVLEPVASNYFQPVFLAVRPFDVKE
jgi:SAM-dependent methyltransferase